MKNRIVHVLVGLLGGLLIISCGEKASESSALFTMVEGEDSGIFFENKLEPTRDFNIYTYRNYYNGGGVAIGDVNNDTLPDVYFTSNQNDNKLYINKGNLQFEDMTNVAGVPGKQSWSTGVTMVDINGDNWLDIYVCNSGDVSGDLKKNELFINNQDGTFDEVAEKWGVADEGFSTHSAFFDYDKDGDLDMYLLNNSYRAIGSFNLQENERTVRDPEGGDKFFRNDGNRFVDVSEEAGIYGSIIGFGLGVTVGDVDKDGWQDIYVSNDFFERDYLYINQQDGTFKETLKDRMKSISVASMGADMADINNDGELDIFVTEMLPNDYKRLKTKTTFEDWNKYQFNLKYDYYHQFTRNMLHVNRGDATYEELGRFAGVEATDWSWGALIEDFDNDGLKDIFVANGIAQDLTDQDFLNFLSNEETVASMIEDGKVNYKKLIDVIPSEKVSNFFFKNTGDLIFEDQTDQAGLKIPSFSNGSAYGDLDLDGDLDLVVNNVNMPAFIYRNESKANYLQLVIEGDDLNTRAIGSKIYVYSDNKLLYQEFMPMKGFQSSMDYMIHFGLGTGEVDSVIVDGNNGTFARLVNPEINKRHYLKPITTQSPSIAKASQSVALMKDITEEVGLSYKHEENRFSDFDNDRLLFYMSSANGPISKVLDVNNDGRDDVVFGGSKGFPTTLYVQDNFGKYKQSNLLDKINPNGEDQDIEILDFDNDGNQDIYLARGGADFAPLSSDIIDKVLINNGHGKLEERNAGLQKNLYSSTSAVASGDFDADGDLDILTAEGMKLGQYGLPTSATLSRNDNGKYVDVTAQVAPDLLEAGMYRDIQFADVNGDGQLDIVAAGHHMGIQVLINNEGVFTDESSRLQLDSLQGWWNTLEVVDIDNDGDMDIIAGNHGLNSRMRATTASPLYLYLGDFDRNGRMDQVLCFVSDGKIKPVALKHDLEKQMPTIRKKYLKYSSFANEGFDEIFSEEDRKNMITLPLYEMRSMVLLNNGTSFDRIPLPYQAQYSPTYAIHVDDLNQDGLPDIILGGNHYEVKPEMGRHDASRGLVLINKGDGSFKSLTAEESGINVEGQIRAIEPITISGKNCILIARNNDSPIIYQLMK